MTENRNVWYRKEDIALTIQKDKDIRNRLLWGKPSNYIKPEGNNIKYAWVIIEGKKEMIGVDNKTMIGYAMKQDVPEWRFPLEKIEYSEFLRWCTSFDL